MSDSVSEFTVEVAKEGKESGLGGGGNQIPKLLGNGRLLRHAVVVGSTCPPGNVLGCERLQLLLFLFLQRLTPWLLQSAPPPP